MTKALITIEVPLEILVKTVKPQAWHSHKTDNKEEMVRLGVSRYIFDLSYYKGSPQEEYPIKKIEFLKEGK